MLQHHTKTNMFQEQIECPKHCKTIINNHGLNVNLRPETQTYFTMSCVISFEFECTIYSTDLKNSWIIENGELRRGDPENASLRNVHIRFISTETKFTA